MNPLDSLVQNPSLQREKKLPPSGWGRNSRFTQRACVEIVRATVDVFSPSLTFVLAFSREFLESEIHYFRYVIVWCL